MAMPKKRLTPNKQGNRRSQIHATLPSVSFCPKCHSPKMAHTVCKVCGEYRGRVVIEKKVKATVVPEAETSK